MIKKIILISSLLSCLFLCSCVIFEKNEIDNTIPVEPEPISVIEDVDTIIMSLDTNKKIKKTIKEHHNDVHDWYMTKIKNSYNGEKRYGNIPRKILYYVNKKI